VTGGRRRGDVLLPFLEEGLEIVCPCLVSLSKTVTRYLLSVLICQTHTSRNLYVSLWLPLIECDWALIKNHPAVHELE
jgi:hypothetical protein